MSTTKAVAKKGNTDVAVFDYGVDADAGYEGMTSEDFMVPFLSLLQSNSPQVEDEDNFPDAKPGLYINTVSNRIYNKDETIILVPCYRTHEYLEWRPRDEGGGLVGKHHIQSDLVKQCKNTQEFGAYKTADGNDLMETFSLYGLTVDPETGEWQPVIMSFKSTHISAYKKVMSNLRTFRLPGGAKPPLYANQLKVGSDKQENNKGKFHVPVLTSLNGGVRESLLDPQSEIYAAAKAFHNDVVADKVKVDYEADAKAAPSSGGGAGAAGDDGEQVPF